LINAEHVTLFRHASHHDEPNDDDEHGIGVRQRSRPVVHRQDTVRHSFQRLQQQPLPSLGRRQNLHADRQVVGEALQYETEKPDSVELTVGAQEVINETTHQHCELTKNDAGFNLFFQSNREECENAPIHFDSPLPHWLSGTLVSTNFLNDIFHC
jgi:hypothetical protein